ncbi:MAG: helix-turn-helix domain-containing protein [Clostridia bacterium]|nr:helix-turn-helix domain-containing protein [Clostridia bacterium]
MGMGIKVRMLMAAKQISLTELAQRIDSSPQNLSGKLTRDNLCEKDIQKIAEACGAKFVGKFVLEDGTEI